MIFVRQDIMNIFTTGYGSVRGGKISPSIRTAATEVDLREMSEEKSFEIRVGPSVLQSSVSGKRPQVGIAWIENGRKQV